MQDDCSVQKAQRAPEKQAPAEIREPALLVFSHLRWHFVTQRPQHLLRRAAQSRPVFFWEEPWMHAADAADTRASNGPALEYLRDAEDPNVTIVRPHLKHGEDLQTAQRQLLEIFLAEQKLEHFDRWYYTPMALGFSRHLRAGVTVYDCMDELSAFLGAPPELIEREQELFRLADVVFTGGRSIYEAKRGRNANVHLFSSSIDAPHFAQALQPQEDPADQAGIARPRAGFFGVIDERFDLELMGTLARERPGVQFVVLGPVVKIDPSDLPQEPNIHYLGSKSYAELPAYLSGWDAALLPFAMNEATRFISPTKTPEYLAAGKRVVSTPIRDVIVDYGEAGLVATAATPQEFAAALDAALAPAAQEDAAWKALVAARLSSMSWDKTWAAMAAEMQLVRRRKQMALNETDALRIKRGSLQRASALAGDRSSIEETPQKNSLRDPYDRDPYDFVVVGAGFAGSVIAERLATQLGKRVLVLDKRSHIAGNAYDFHNKDGIMVHQYGPHIFHTSSQKVVEHLSQFTEWRPYEHRVLAEVDGKLLPVPINLDTINGLYGLNLDSKGMETFLAERVEARSEIRSSEDIVLSRVGRELYEKFFRNYTRKQWGLDPSELDSSVAGRIPVRFDRDDRYFTDSFQAMPLEGYTRMFERMLANPRITVRLSTDYRDVVGHFPSAKVVYTGPIDEYFDYQFGPLPYRSLTFVHETIDAEQFQPAPVVNYPNTHEYTRVTEFKYLTGQEHPKTSVVYEYPTAEGDPYYPIPRAENAELYERYRALAVATEGVYFCGRLANYKYFNMDQVVAQALHVYRNIAEDEEALDLPARPAGVLASTSAAMPAAR